MGMKLSLNAPRAATAAILIVQSCRVELRAARLAPADSLWQPYLFYLHITTETVEAAEAARCKRR